MISSAIIRRGLLFIFVLIVFSPLAALMADTIQALWSGHSSWLYLMIPSGRRLALLIRGVMLSLSVATGSMFVGILGALALMWRASDRMNHLRWLVFLWIVVPPAIHALTWMTLFQKAGTLMSAIGLFEISFQGWFAVWWIECMALSPLCVGLTLIAFEAVDPALIETSRLVRDDSQTLYKIVLPIARPLILAGASLVFLISLMDYGVPSIFHVNVYPMEIFAEYSAGNEPVRAFLSAIPLLCISVCILIAVHAPLKDAVMKPAPAASHIRPPVWPFWIRVLQAKGFIFLALIVLAPLIVLTGMSGSLNRLSASVGAANADIGFTLMISLVSAIISLPLAFAVAEKLARQDIKNTAWWIAGLLPLALPGTLTGIGLIMLWNKSLTGFIYDSACMPVLAALARFTPLAALVFAAQLKRMDSTLIDAARVFQKSGANAWRRVYLPMMAPVMLAAGFIVFACTAGELCATLIVAPPGRATVIMRIYSYLHYGASDAVAGLCLFIALLSAFLSVAALLLLTKKRTVSSQESKPIC